jgi:tRNA threonylcarbamoyladenosine biosynthesis protein TsaE
VSAFAIDLPDAAATTRLGAAIAAALRVGDVVALSGGLGAGKTTLARAIIAALGYRGEVPSPSFAIIESYDPPALRLPVVHADFYRLAQPAEVEELGLDDSRAHAVLIAEWPDHAGGFAHEPACLAITLEGLPQGRRGEVADAVVGGGRRAIVEPGVDWLGRAAWIPA